MDQSENQLDTELMRRIAGGDERAFSTLYQRFAPALYGMAFRMMNDGREAEDVLQEGFTYLWRKASSFDSARGSAFAWAVMIVRHKAIDKLRVRQRDERLRVRAAGETDLAAGMMDDCSGEGLIARERSAEVRAALAQLAPEQREALDLAFFDGLTHEQIAERLGTPLGTIKARIRRGLLKMRDVFRGASNG
ncbi:MAG: sigma-70 family RNA polymerase sigma factor [Verrucomicrobia bacterium]|nr:sigma-70 family RNA polymerase sigma factor [Verrucomicrobiota bacterium]